MIINAIDEYIKSLDNLKECELNLIKEGYISFWKLKYGLNVDTIDLKCCFRADYNLNYNECVNEKNITAQAEEIFYSMVENGHLDYKDIQEYEKIYNNILKHDSICIECNPIKYNIYTDKPCICKKLFIEDKKKNIERKKISPNNKITDITKIMFEEVKDALENNPSIFKSYSKGLTAPLFKYASQYGILDGILSVKFLYTNTIKMDILANCFNWNETWDEFGNKKNRFFNVIDKKIIPLRCIGSSKAYTDDISSNIYKNLIYVDIDSIEIMINEINIDVSLLNRNALNKIFISNSQCPLYRYVSYVKDLEILTTGESDFSITDKKCIQLVRFIYLLKIFNCFTEKDYYFINDICNGKHSNIINIGKNDINAFLIIWKYLSQKDNINFERKQYYNLFKENKHYNHLYFNTYTRETLSEFFNNCLKNQGFGILDKDLLLWFLNNSSLEL